MKKRYFYFLLIFFVGISFSSQAQVIRGAVFGGLNISQVAGDEVYGFKQPGAHVGAAAIIPFTEHWSLTLETLFSMEGAKQKARRESSPYYAPFDSIAGVWKNPYDPYDSIVYLNGAYNLRLNYVRVPILLHYVDDIFAIGAGIQYGRLVSVKEKEQDIYNTTTTAEAAYDKNDLSILADLRFRIYKGLYINARYSYSLMSIRERTFTDVNSWETIETRKQYSNVLTFRLMWVINDKGRTLKRQTLEENRPL